MSCKLDFSINVSTRTQDISSSSLDDYSRADLLHCFQILRQVGRMCEDATVFCTRNFMHGWVLQATTYDLHAWARPSGQIPITSPLNNAASGSKVKVLSMATRELLAGWVLQATTYRWGFRASSSKQLSMKHKTNFRMESEDLIESLESK